MTLSVIMRPTERCNLACAYCYAWPPATDDGMSRRVLVAAMEGAASEASDRSVHFMWHGGEPLLVGLDFYREVASVSGSLRKRGYRVANSIQSNGTLVSSGLAELIERENDFFVGISIDGPEDITSQTRRFPDGRSAFADIMKGLDTLKRVRHRDGAVSVGAIAVLSRANVHRVLDVYDFCRGQGLALKLSPVFLSGRAGPDHAITPREFGDALVCLFERWVNDPSPARVSNLREMLGNLLDERPVGCNFAGSCGKRFVAIGPHGDIFPCGRFSNAPGFRLGNLFEGGGIGEARRTRVAEALCRRRVASCDPCRFRAVCNGGCPHGAFSATGTITARDPYCLSYRMAYGAMQGFVAEQARQASEVTNGH